MNRGGKERKMCRWKALHLRLHQIRGRKLSQSQQNTRGRQTEEGCVKKTGRSEGVCEGCSIHRSDQDQFIKAVWGEKKHTPTPLISPPPLCLRLPLTSRRRDGSCTWGDWGLTAPAPSWSAALKSLAKSRSVQWTWGTTGKLPPLLPPLPAGLPVFSRKSLCNCWFWSKLSWFASQYDANLLKMSPPNN